MSHDTDRNAEDARLTAYALGELTGDDARALEARLAADPAMRAELEELRVTIGAVTAAAKAEIAATPVAGEAAAAGGAPAPVLRPFFASLRRITTAAAVIVAAAGTFVWYEAKHGLLGHSGGSSRMSKTDGRYDLEAESPDAIAVGTRPEPVAASKYGQDFDVEIAQGATLSDELVVGLPAADMPAPDSPEPTDNNEEWPESKVEAAAHADRPFDRVNANDAIGLGGGERRKSARGAPRKERDSLDAFSRGVRLPGDSEPSTGEDYELPPENAFVRPLGRAALSTFALDVDTASYANVRRMIDAGQRPPRNAVRVEEFVNAFRYRDPAPTGDRPLAMTATVATCPWEPRHKLLRVALKARDIDWAKRPRANLVFLMDVSGSMDDPKKLPLVVRTLKLLTDQLGENDTLSIVVYAGSSGVALPPTRGHKGVEIRDALDRLKAGGSTNGGEGIELAYKLARENFVEGGVNRVILCTDGDFNVGVTSKDALYELIADRAKSGVFLTALGFGYGNLKDATLEQLANRGNGNYGYVDDDREAKKLLVENLTGTLITVAKDVKLQLEFNPSAVGAYRLIGYENRLMAARDFRNDAKDAGEVGAGHVVTALYEIVPPEALPQSPVDPPLRYQSPSAPEPETAPAPRTEGKDELCTVFLRWKKPEAAAAEETSFPVKPTDAASGAAAEDATFAAAVALFAMELRGSQFKGRGDWNLIEELARAAAGTVGDRGEKDPWGERAEFLTLVRKARQLR